MMYIVKTNTSKHKNNKYYSFRLVESARTPTNKIRQRTLLNLGNNYYTIQENEWKPLTDRIESILSGATLLLPFPNHIEHEAERIANLLIKKHGKEIAARNSIHHFETIDINSIILHEILTIFSEYKFR